MIENPLTFRDYFCKELIWDCSKVHVKSKFAWKTLRLLETFLLETNELFITSWSNCTFKAF